MLTLGANYGGTDRNCMPFAEQQNNNTLRPLSQSFIQKAQQAIGNQYNLGNRSTAIEMERKLTDYQGAVGKTGYDFNSDFANNFEGEFRPGFEAPWGYVVGKKLLKFQIYGGKEHHLCLLLMVY